MTTGGRRRRFWQVVFSVLLLAAIAVPVSIAVRGLLGDGREYRGTVTVTDCRFLTFSQHGKVYECRGSFTADDGSLVVPDADFSHLGRLDPGTRVRATVAGPDDRTAHLASEAHWLLIVTGGAAVGLLVVLIALWWIPGQARRRDPSTGVPTA